MRRTQFFRTLGRVKTLLNLVLGLLLLLILLYAGYEIVKSKLMTREVSNMVTIQPQQQAGTQLALGGFEEIPGTPFLVAPLYSTQNYRSSYYEKEVGAVRNYLFVNVNDRASRWLMTSNQLLILNKAELAVEDVKTPEAKVVKWLWYSVVTSDSNQDERLTEEDAQTISVSDPSGKGYIELLQNIEKVLGSTFRNGDTLLIFYRTKQKYFVSEINLPKRQVIETKALAPMPS